MPYAAELINHIRDRIYETAYLGDFVVRQSTFADSAQSWSVDVESIDAATYDLSVKNPNGGDEAALRTPAEILDEISALDAESAAVLATIRGSM